MSQLVNTNANANTNTNTSHALLKLAKDLIKKVNRTRNYEQKNITQRHALFSNNKKYDPLRDASFELYRCILAKKINMSNIFVFEHMLKEKDRFNEGNIKLQDASQNVAKVLAKEYKLDMSKFKKADDKSDDPEPSADDVKQ